jgi:hypothetical protein
VESKVLFHARNKKAVAIGTHATWEAAHRGWPGRRADGRATPEPNRAEIPAAAQSTCDDLGGPRSIDQPLNSASFHSVEGMHNIAVVEHGEQALDSVHRPAESFQSIWCANRRSVARYNALPQLRPRCATRTCRCMGRVSKPICLPIDRVKVNPGARARGLKPLCSAGAVAF